MKILQVLKQKSAGILTKENAPLSYPASWQQKELSRFPEPADDVERAYFQYCCQMHLAKSYAPALLNFAGLLLLPLFRLRFARQRTATPPQTADAVFAYGGRPDILPASLQQEFPGWVQCRDFQSHTALNQEDIRFLRKLRRRYPFSFFFRFKCMVKVAMYRPMINTYAPKAIIVSEEYSFTSSLLSAYCKSLGVEHINVMHGEKLYYIRDSFFHFDRCYVWDGFYRKLFCALRAEPAQFRVELPAAMQPWEKGDTPPEIDLTYYLQAESPAQLQRIAGVLHTLAQQGMVIAVRPHPLYSDRAAVEKLFSFCLIEDNAALDIRTSVLRTRRAASLYSTVLMQAHISGTVPVIDDLTSPEHFAQLQDLKYIMLDKPHQLLSEIVRKENGHHERDA